MKNSLYYGDNLEVLRKHIRDETIDLCYIDPPFNSKRNYNQIYNNIGGEDRAQAQAFVDTWTWDAHANDCFGQIIENKNGVQTQRSIDLISGLEKVLGRGSLFAYLVTMAVRIAEIQRVLKQTGSFYLHCDPTASHYLKLVCDAIFVTQGGHYLNEFIWCYGERGLAKRYFNKKHDVILFYSKSDRHTFNYKEVAQAYADATIKKFRYADEDGRRFRLRGRNVPEAGSLRRKTDIPLALESEYTYRQYLDESEGVLAYDWVEIDFLNQAADERLGYPTQKPEALLELLVLASSNKGDTILDAYCGCGTSVVVAQRFERRWIGIDITYQSISLVLRRLEGIFKKKILDTVTLNGIPRDMESAVALAHKQDDRVRKEFEKWAVLTYTTNRAIISDKKGADRGIDGFGFFLIGKDENAKIIFQVKSGHIKRGDIATLRGDMEREQATLAVFITLEEPTRPMNEEAKAAGTYRHPHMPTPYDKIKIVTVREILEEDKRLDIPMSLEVLKEAQRDIEDKQLSLLGAKTS
jgi:site-specific DNA-methyltransferase (adenine-specific)